MKFAESFGEAVVRYPEIWADQSVNWRDGGRIARAECGCVHSCGYTAPCDLHASTYLACLECAVMRFTGGRAEWIAGEDAYPDGRGARVRVSNIVPQNMMLKLAFRVLRVLFGDCGMVAAWTRSWRCLWLVDVVDGPTLGPYSRRDDAVTSERWWLRMNRGL